MGVEIVGEKIRLIEGFPEKLANEIKHCILSHHGEYEYGSPKKPAIIEAVALNFADNTDAKLQTLTEIMGSNRQKVRTGWDITVYLNRISERQGNISEK
jgi:3'-5' exoribonuclease